jgi:hypothetical protein
MKEGEKSKKSSKKWVIAIVLVIIIAAIALIFYQGIFTLPTGLVTGTENTGANENTPTPASAPTPVSGPTITPTGNEIISKSLVNVSLPYYEAIDLEPGKYGIEISSDDPIWIRLYSKLDFDEWQKTGTHRSALVGTGLGENDKTKSLIVTFLIYSYSPRKYYLLFLGDKTTIKFKITQILKLQ